MAASVPLRAAFDAEGLRGLARDGMDGFEHLHVPYSAEQLGRILRHLTIRQAAGLVG